MIVARPRPEDPDLGHARALERIEARLGERWGGAWGQQEGSTTVLQIGVVGPTVDDVLAIHGEREGLGQPPTVVSVARSWADLLALLDREGPEATYEARRTQGGNNNAYCQDNETSWFDWMLLAKRADVHRFVTLLNAHRVLRDVEHEWQRVALNQVIRQAELTWHGVRLHEPDWGHDSHSVALTTRYTAEGVFFHFIFNAYWEPLEFELPSAAEGCVRPWHRWIDTFLDSPQDIVDWDQAPLVPSATYRAEPHSVVVLFTGLEPERQSPGHG